MDVCARHIFVIQAISGRRIGRFAMRTNKNLSSTSRFMTRKMLRIQASLVLAVRARIWFRP